MTVVAGGALCRMVLALLAAAVLAACEGITIGPVDTSCHANPNRGMGSGCSGGNH